ncbi:MAG: hypothetical protein PHF42_05345 [Pseudomonas sp.]|nr:hypothetical protein [Pseudomonas sp.]
MTAQHSIAPTQLRDFLKFQGWEILDVALRDRLFVLSHPAYDRRQLVYPMDSDAPDYEESVQRIFNNLAEITHTSVQVLHSKARAVHDDLLGFHIHFSGNEHSLPLGFATKLLPQTETIIKSAACTVVRPQTHHSRLTLTEATQLIEKTRFQHTEHGSFVLKTSCAVHAIQTQGQLDLHTSAHSDSISSQTSLPFVRKVNLVLNQALQALVTAIEGDKITQLLDHLKQDERPYISSNLCAALVEMQDEKLENDLSIHFGWAASLPAPASQPTIIRLQRDYFPRIEEIRRELRGTQTQREEIFIGSVERLEGTMNEQGQRAGDVVLSLFLPDEEGLVKARVYLQATDYAQAMRAHETHGAYVQVAGQLQAGSRVRQLVHVTSFRVMGVTG